MAELVLGTAQWGAGYGVTNSRGRLDDPGIAEIARHALAAGLRSVDTAASYGDAQQRLRPWRDRFEVTTKVSGAEPGRIHERLVGALTALGCDVVHACLLHDWDSLSPDVASEAAYALEAAREAGLTSRVGVSVYDDAALARAGLAFARLDVVQVPANALDRRLDDAATLHGLAAAGTVVQVRSVFLQGLLAGPSTAPLAGHPHVLRFHEAARAADVSPLALALAHARALAWADQIVVGVTSAAELRQILWARDHMTAHLAPKDLGSGDLDLLDPRRWGDPPWW